MLIEIVGGYFTYFLGNKYNVGRASPPKTRYSKYIVIIECNYCILDCDLLSITHGTLYQGAWSKDSAVAWTRKITVLIRIKWGQRIVRRIGTIVIIALIALTTREARLINPKAWIIRDLIEAQKEKTEDKE